MCSRLDCNPHINLQFEIGNVLAELLPKYIDTGYLVYATPLQFYPFETLQEFLPRSKKMHVI